MHVGIANPRWRGKRSRRMRNLQFYVSDKRPTTEIIITNTIYIMLGVDSPIYHTHVPSFPVCIFYMPKLTISPLVHVCVSKHWDGQNTCLQFLPPDLRVLLMVPIFNKKMHIKLWSCASLDYLWFVQDSWPVSMPIGSVYSATRVLWLPHTPTSTPGPPFTNMV